MSEGQSNGELTSGERAWLRMAKPQLAAYLNTVLLLDEYGRPGLRACDLAPTMELCYNFAYKKFGPKEVRQEVVQALAVIAQSYIDDAFSSP